MQTLLPTILVLMAGFSLFPVPLGMYSWYARSERRVWAAMGAWSLTIVGIAVTTLLLSDPTTSAADISTLATIRHVLFGFSLLAVLWTLSELAGRKIYWLLEIFAAVIVVRAYLWIATDHLFTHGVSDDGLLIYGPYRVPATAVVALLFITILIVILSRPWPKADLRRVTGFVMIPTTIVSMIAASIQNIYGEFLTAAVFVVPVVVIQAYLFHDFTTYVKRTQRMNVRESKLAAFGRAALMPGEVVPSRAAVDLIMSEIHPDRCEYVEYDHNDQEIIAYGGRRVDPRTPPRQVVDVELAGQPVGKLQVYGDPSTEDQLFVRSVGLVLSAAIARTRLESSIRESSLRDPLTDLPNWLLLQDRLSRLLLRADVAPVAVLCCDIVELKGINDEHGHHAGDAVLRAVADRLQDIVAAEGTVARLGADEFVLVQPLVHEADAEGLARAVANISALPVDVAGGDVVFAVRVGTALGTDPTVSSDRIIQDAEIALMQAKSAAQTQVSFADSARQAVDERRRLVRALAEGVKGEEFTVYYQPIVEMATNRVVAVESLARWNRPDGTSYGPDEFIPVAESIGLMMPITQQVFTQALAAMSQWQRHDPDLADLSMSLNLTPVVVNHPELLEWLQITLEGGEVEPSRLTLELTESALQEASESALTRLEDLTALGLHLSLDDFGTGYSSLTRLVVMPVDELKIDRSFTQSMEGQERSVAPAVIALAHAFKLSVVGEGVETTAHRDFLMQSGCQLGQGYLYSRPVEASEVPGTIARIEAMPVPGPPAPRRPQDIPS